MNEEYLKGLTKEELIEIIYNETTCTYQLKEVIQNIDKDVFFLITDTYEIYGGV